MKKCKGCGELKYISEFYEHPATKDGHLGSCKECKKKYARSYEKTDAGKLVEKRRNSKPERQSNIAKTTRAWQIENPEKRLAHSRLWHAIYDGRVVRKTTCDDCGVTGKIVAHHEDYTKALDVDWLCSPCHGKRHPKYIQETCTIE
jgi:hypothetical protein